MSVARISNTLNYNHNHRIITEIGAEGQHYNTEFISAKAHLLEVTQNSTYPTTHHISTIEMETDDIKDSTTTNTSPDTSNNSNTNNNNNSRSRPQIQSQTQASIQLPTKPPPPTKDEYLKSLATHIIAKRDRIYMEHKQNGKGSGQIFELTP